ncbi:MAG: DUF1573 domain-containing protein [Bacteroidota bacterium]|nr:DUF1573 domain-containing protein [Bacteroidota bacterium]MDP4218743.1 DUF1573 domain-containing protein [Bacteroidota bacterium]MDP4244681.1 DUF1573 domain-containing protein [Bacteroidota bacterium]MDP4253265.1 DUF1573 domain-containing protein [Bacteroidota bacterium]MDP4256886.1 DUF1573 domain-containing protein [Bacteroidota bacterium]
MKRVLLFAGALILSASLFAQKKAEDVVKFKETAHDFGKIKQGTPVTYNFEFTNTSDGPVVIESASPSCGCTTPVKPEGAIAKGKDDKIIAGFNAAAPGPFNKTIAIKVAGIDLPVTLRITGMVLSADDYAKFQSGQGGAKPGSR